MGRPRADGVVPRRRGDRRVRRDARTTPPASSTGTPSTRTCSTPSAAPQTGDASSRSRRTANPRTSGSPAPSPCPPAVASSPSGLPATPSSAGTSCSSRRTPSGEDDWTTLPDANGHTTQDTGSACPVWLDVHPFLTHYQTPDDGEGCPPTGTTGTWYAASRRERRLGAVADRPARLRRRATVEVSITYASDDVRPGRRRLRRRHRRLDRRGPTSFEADGDTIDGWTVPGAARGQPRQRERLDRRHRRRRAAAARRRIDAVARSRGSRRSSRFLAGRFGPYPFSRGRRHRRRRRGLGFALENQTRPIYAPGFFRPRSRATASSSMSSPTSGTATASP